MVRRVTIAFMISFFLVAVISLPEENAAQAQCNDPGGPVCDEPSPQEPGDGTFIQGLPGDHDGDGTLDGGDLCREEPGPNWNYGCPEGVDTNAMLQPASTEEAAPAAPESTEEPFVPPSVNGLDECILTPSILQNIFIRLWPLADADIRGHIVPGARYPVSMIFHIAGQTFYGIDGGWIESSVVNLSSDGSCDTIPQYTMHLTPDQWTQLLTSGKKFACVGEFSSENGPTCSQEFFPVDPLDFGPVIPLILLVSDHIGGPISTTFIGGVHVAVGDINGDGTDDTAFGRLPDDFQPVSQGFPPDPLGPFSNLLVADENGHLTLVMGGNCPPFRCGYNDISFALAFDPQAEHDPQFFMYNGVARDASAFQVAVLDAEEGIFALKMTPYGPETGPRFLPGQVIFTGLSTYMTQDFSVEQFPADISALVPFEEQVPVGALSPLIANEDAYLQWVAEHEPDQAPLVLAVQAGTELANQLNNRHLNLNDPANSAQTLLLNADEEIEVASGEWFAYRAQEVPVSDELGINADASRQPLLSVRTDACDCELMVSFTVPTQASDQFLGFLQIGIQP